MIPNPGTWSRINGSGTGDSDPAVRVEKVYLHGGFQPGVDEDQVAPQPNVRNCPVPHLGKVDRDHDWKHGNRNLVVTLGCPVTDLETKHEHVSASTRGAMKEATADLGAAIVTRGPDSCSH